MARPVYRKGQQEIVRCPVDSATVVAAGDLLFLDTDDAKPAASFTWDTDIATTQAGFAAVFLGVSLHASASGATDPVDVDISPSSVWDFDVASATFAVGTPLGPDKASGNTMLSQTLETAVAASSVARAFVYAAAAVTRLNVKFASAFNTASGNVNANLG